MKRIVSLLPAATEIAAALGLMDQIVGVSHECDFPREANERPRVTHCPVHNAGLTSGEVDEWVRGSLRENGTIYVPNSPIQLPTSNVSGALPASFTLGVRPEDVQPNNDGPFTGRVALIEPLGVETLLHIKSGEQTLVSTVPGMTRIQLGSDLRFDIVRERLHFFDSSGERVKG